MTFTEYLKSKLGEYQIQTGKHGGVIHDKPEPYKTYDDLLIVSNGWSDREDGRALSSLMQHFESKGRADLNPKLKDVWAEYRTETPRPAA
jgi:hypothetical protein